MHGALSPLKGKSNVRERKGRASTGRQQRTRKRNTTPHKRENEDGKGGEGEGEEPETLRPCNPCRPRFPEGHRRWILKLEVGRPAIHIYVHANTSTHKHASQ